MSDLLLQKLEEIKAKSRSKHEATIQLKIAHETKEKLFAALDKDDLTFKDLVTAAIDVYLESKGNK